MSDTSILRVCEKQRYVLVQMPVCTDSSEPCLLADTISYQNLVRWPILFYLNKNI